MRPSAAAGARTERALVTLMGKAKAAGKQCKPGQQRAYVQLLAPRGTFHVACCRRQACGLLVVSFGSLGVALCFLSVAWIGVGS